MQMPGMDGAMLARNIKSDPALAGIPLVLLTSLGHGNGSMPQIGHCCHADQAGQRVRSLRYACQPARDARTAGPFRRQVEPAIAHDEAVEAQETHPTTVRILVAEDNAINQKVALRMLEKLGYRADVVGNGREAVEALKQMPYDLVLMDCNMPEMDGFDATSALRQLEGANRHTVIVAMTANALRGDRDRVLEAGMDDYIAKPINQRELAALIREWTAKMRGNGNGAQPKEVLDHRRLTELQDLAAGEKPGWLPELAQEYMADAALRIVEMQKAAAADDAAAVGRLAHALKGSSKNLGIVNVVPACQGLQQAGESGNCVQMPALMQELEREFARAKAELEHHLGMKGRK